MTNTSNRYNAGEGAAMGRGLAASSRTMEIFSIVPKVLTVAPGTGMEEGTDVVPGTGMAAGLQCSQIGTN